MPHFFCCSITSKRRNQACQHVCTTTWPHKSKSSIGIRYNKISSQLVLAKQKPRYPNIKCKSLTIDAIETHSVLELGETEHANQSQGRVAMVQRHSETCLSSMYSHGCSAVLMLNDSTLLCIEAFYLISFVGALLSCVGGRTPENTHLTRIRSKVSLAGWYGRIGYCETCERMYRLISFVFDVTSQARIVDETLLVALSAC